MANESGVKLDNAEGGYSAGWGPTCQWYDARLGGAVPRRAVQRAFKVVWAVNEGLVEVDIPTTAEAAAQAVARERAEPTSAALTRALGGVPVQTSKQSQTTTATTKATAMATATTPHAGGLGLGGGEEAGGAAGEAAGGAAGEGAGEVAGEGQMQIGQSQKQAVGDETLTRNELATTVAGTAAAGTAAAGTAAATAADVDADANAIAVEDETRWRACGEWGALDVQRQGSVEWGAGVIVRERVALLSEVGDARRDLSLAAACSLVMPAIVKNKPLKLVEEAVFESAKVVMWGYNAPLRCMSARVQQVMSVYSHHN